MCSSELVILRILRIMLPAWRSAWRSGEAAQGRESLLNKWFVARLEAPVGQAGSRLCRGELSRGTNLCFCSAVQRGVAGSPRWLRRGQKQYCSAWHCAGCTRCTSSSSSSSFLLHSLHASPSSRGPLPLFYCPLCFYSDVNFSMQLVLCLVLFV